MSARERKERETLAAWTPQLAGKAEPIEEPRKLDYINGEDITTDDEVFADELVEGLILRDSLACFYGDSNAGKTTLAAELAAAVAEGKKFFSRNVNGGLVVYLATENPHSVQGRFKAIKKKAGCKLRRLEVVRSPINLFDGDADVNAVLALIREVEERHDETIAMIIGDTLAAMSVGADENTAKDMGVVLRNMNMIRSKTRAAFVLIHHPGKDATRGMRGWSGLRAALDTEIQVEDSAEGLRIVEITKQRDLGTKGERLAFTLEAVLIGRNEWGNDRTTPVVVPAVAPARKPKHAEKKSSHQETIVEFVKSRSKGCSRTEIGQHFKGREPASYTITKQLARLVEREQLRLVDGIYVASVEPVAPLRVAGP